MCWIWICAVTAIAEQRHVLRQVPGVWMGTAASQFEWADLPGLVGCFDSSVSTSVLHSTYNTTNWADCSGNRTLIASATNLCPQYVEDATNGMPGVRFDGVDDFMVLSPAFDSHTGTVVAVYSRENQAGYVVPCGNLTTRYSFPVYWQNDDVVRSKMSKWGYTLTTQDVTGTHCSIAISNGETNDLTYILDGVEYPPLAPVDYSASDLNVIHVGGSRMGSSAYHYHEGYLFLLLFYDRPIDAGEIAQIETKIESRWPVVFP